MSDRNQRNLVPSGGGFFHQLALRIKLVLRLMGDSRVSPLLKLIPFGALLYLIIPEPIVGPVDDGAVLGIGLYLFVELCPPEIVDEHMRELTRVVPGEFRDPGGPDDDDGEVVDAEYWEEK
jgi:hypothetical protein